MRLPESADEDSGGSGGESQPDDDEKEKEKEKEEKKRRKRKRRKRKRRKKRRKRQSWRRKADSRMNDKWPSGIWPVFPAPFSNDIESPGYMAACMRSCGTELPCFGAASSLTNILAAIPARS